MSRRLPEPGRLATIIDDGVRRLSVRARRHAQVLRELAGLVDHDLKAPRVPTTILFVHGYLAPLPEAYWLGSLRLVVDLRRRGLDLRFVRAPVTGTVAERAQRTAAELRKTRAERVVVVGHSMGGLDARYAAVHHDAERRITDVITLGTPHRGTMLADVFDRLRPRLPLALRQLDQGGLKDLTRAAARRFNEAVPDRADVRYQSLCGRVPPETVPPMLRTLARRLQSHEGDNDSLVSVHSATWGATTVLDDADHWALIGLEWVSGADLRHRVARLRDGRRPLAVLRERLDAVLSRAP